LDAIADAEFDQDVRNVRLYGREREVGCGGNLLVRLADGQTRQDLPFTRAQIVDRRDAAAAAPAASDQPQPGKHERGRRWRDDRMPHRDVADRIAELLP
jgi:hypothetical protein